jgi:thiol-disulfide isomerase/thioredoxin
MKPSRRFALIAGVAVLSLAAGLALRTHPSAGGAAAPGAALAQLRSAHLPATGGATLDWTRLQGKIVVVNFWATWCEPCKREIPLLAEMQARFQSQGVEVVGIAIDNMAKVREFLPNSAINYTVAIGGMDMLDVLKGLGDPSGALPFSVVLDRHGEPIGHKLGAFSRDELAGLLLPALSEGPGRPHPG